MSNLLTTLVVQIYEAGEVGLGEPKGGASEIDNLKTENERLKNQLLDMYERRDNATSANRQPLKLDLAEKVQLAT